MTDITQLNLYELFNVDETCSTQELTTAFRKKALKCHPDKYPDDNEKKELFLLIKKSLELLIDEKARNAYDANRKQKKIQQERLSQMDDNRKKFRQDLERREQKASQTTNSPINRFNADKLRVEVERIRREGSRLVDEELEKLHQLIEEDKRNNSLNHVNVIIKYLPNTRLYTENELRLIFEKYGKISTIISKDSKCALIEFNDDHISNFIENEKGLEGRPFASVKIQKKKNTTTTTSSSPCTKRQYDVVDLTKPEFEDLEAMILKKMAQQTTTS
jgi:DnaJ family protein C protein 17